jgi:hypothetical protein
MLDDEKLAAIITEAGKLRSSVEPGHISDTPQEIHSAILHTRAVLDRLEALTAHVGGKHALAVQQAEDCKAALQDKWNQSATAPQGFGHSDSAPRERYATYSLLTVQEDLNLRVAEREERKFAATLDLLRLMYRGVDGHRRDLELRVRLINIEGMLEK